MFKAVHQSQTNQCCIFLPQHDVWTMFSWTMDHDFICSFLAFLSFPCDNGVGSYKEQRLVVGVAYISKQAAVSRNAQVYTQSCRV